MSQNYRNVVNTRTRLDVCKKSQILGVTLERSTPQIRIERATLKKLLREPKLPLVFNLFVKVKLHVVFSCLALGVAGSKFLWSGGLW